MFWPLQLNSKCLGVLKDFQVPFSRVWVATSHFPRSGVVITSKWFFVHNLCFKCPNGRCEPILDIYTSIVFQWHKKLFEMMGFDPYNHSLKIQESIWNSNSQHGSSFGSLRVHSFTIFALLETCDVTPRSFFWLTTLQPLTLVASPRLGLRHLKHAK